MSDEQNSGAIFSRREEPIILEDDLDSPAVGTRHVYEIDDGEQHWYVALSSVAAVAAHRELLSEPALDCFVTEIADDRQLTISFPDEAGRQPETKTCKEWAALEEGFLASTVS